MGHLASVCVCKNVPPEIASTAVLSWLVPLGGRGYQRKGVSNPWGA